MGGIGSGTRVNKKRTVEDCYTLDIARLRRRGMLKPGAGLQWGVLRWASLMRTGFVTFYDIDIPAGAVAGTMRLMHCDDSGELRDTYAVGLTANVCHLGGVRWWLECPQSKGVTPCGRRTRKLYLSGDTFGCRTCHDLTYESRQFSDKRVAAVLKAGNDLSKFEFRPGMTVAQAIFATKVFRADVVRRERANRRTLRGTRSK